MADKSKHLHGLTLFDGTRLSLTNHNPNQHSITVNGDQLSYNDIALGSLRITANKTYTLDEADGQYYQVLNTNSEIDIKFEEEVQPGKVASGQIIPAGNQLFKQQSPAPFAYIDTTGRLGSTNMWNSLFVANIMGYVDIDKDANTYKHGLVPAGSATHGSMFLRKDGQWAQMSAFTGSVADTLLSLQDTPATYTGNIGKYLRVSYDEGGSIQFDSLSTAKVPENTNLYYTDTRVDTRITSKLNDSSISDIAISGTVTCNELLAQSDMRLKEDITDLDCEECLGIVGEMQPKQYKFKGKSQKRYGLIAQELEVVLPELVGGTQESKSVNYMEVIPFLIGSIKQLKEEIRCLQFDVEIISRQNK
jgi:hypothetical protein